jgi:hypothetical protein
VQFHGIHTCQPGVISIRLLADSMVDFGGGIIADRTVAVVLAMASEESPGSMDKLPGNTWARTRLVHQLHRCRLDS